MRLLFTVWLVVAAVAGTCRSQCVNVKPMQNFNEKDIMGTWYVLEETNEENPNFPKQNCQDLQITKLGPNKWMLNGSGIDTTTGNLDTWQATGPMTQNGIFNLSDNTAYGVINFVTTVLGTNGKDYSVFYVCTVTNPPTGYVWVNSKTPHKNLSQMSAQQQKAINTILTGNGLDPASLKVLDNSKCP